MNQQTLTPSQSSGSRRLARSIADVGLVVLLLAAFVQVALAGGAVFGAAGWTMHVVLGSTIAAVSALTLLAALIGRPPALRLALTAVVLGVALLQAIASVLASRVDPAFGLLHGLGAATLVALLTFLVFSRKDAVQPGSASR